MIPVRSGTYERKIDINQFGWTSLRIGAGAGVNSIFKDHVLWTCSQEQQQEQVGYAISSTPNSERFELTRIKLNCDLTPNLTIQEDSGNPMNWPCTVEYMLYLTRFEETYSAGSMFNAPTNVLVLGAPWSRTLLLDRSTPVEQVIDCGVETVQPPLASQSAYVWNPAIYEFVIAEGSGTLTTISNSSASFTPRFFAMTKNCASIKIDKCFDVPQVFGKKTQLRMHWRVSTPPLGPPWWRSLLNGQDGSIQASINVNGNVIVEYRT